MGFRQRLNDALNSLGLRWAEVEEVDESSVNLLLIVEVPFQGFLELGPLFRCFEVRTLARHGVVGKP